MSFAQNQLLRFLAAFGRRGITRFDFIVRKRTSEGHEAGCIHPAQHAHLAGLTPEQLVAQRLLAFLRAQNAAGHDIGFRPDPTILHAALLIDDLSLQHAHAVSAELNAAIVETSVGNTQLWLFADTAMDTNARKSLERQYAMQFDADASCADGQHFGRLPGFKNWKPGRQQCWVNFVGESMGPFVAAGSNSAIEQSPPLGGGASKINEAPAKAPLIIVKADDSDPAPRELGWAIHALRRGIAEAEVESHLLERALIRRKSGAPSYAKRTVKKAAGIVQQD